VNKENLLCQLVNENILLSEMTFSYRRTWSVTVQELLLGFDYHPEMTQMSVIRSFLGIGDDSQFDDATGQEVEKHN
jgi:hypothetical protein